MDVLSDDLIDLINKMLLPMADERASLDDVIGHPWMSGEEYTLEEI